MSNSTNSDTGNYEYNPDRPAALFFCVAYGLVGIAHVVQASRAKSWWIWPLILGIILEAEGYAFRYLSAKEFFTLWPLIISQVSIIVAPAFMAAADYMLVGRLISYLGGEHSIIKHTLITKIFVTSDFLAILSQAIGGSMISSTDLTVLKAGFKLLIGALGFQAGMFTLFTALTINFDIRTRKALGPQRRQVNTLFIAFYITAVLIIFRSIYRALEFASVKFTPTSASGYTLTHEWLFYVFDAVPIFVAVLTLNIIHPSKFVPNKKGLRLDGTYEPQGRGCCGCCSRSRKPVPIARVPSDTNIPLHSTSHVAQEGKPWPGYVQVASDNVV